MTDRIVEISNPAELSVRLDQLVIATEVVPPVSTPLAELGVLLIAHPRVTLTQAVLSRIAANGGTVVTCDESYLPAAMLLPVQAHYIQTERFAKQMQMTIPLRKRLWRSIVAAKIRAQGELLKELHENDSGLLPMSGSVQSGDKGNLESVAARRYWPLVSEIRNSAVEESGTTKTGILITATPCSGRLPLAHCARRAFILPSEFAIRTATIHSASPPT